MLTVPIRDINGAQFRAELATAGITVGERDMWAEGGRLHFPTLNDTNRSKVEQVLTAHTPDPKWAATPQEANAHTLRDRAAAALETNRTYLALGSPTAAQTAAQVKALTRECSALIRLTLNALDSTE